MACSDLLHESIVNLETWRTCSVQCTTTARRVHNSCVMHHFGCSLIHLELSMRMSTAVPYPLPVIPKYPGPAGITIKGDDERIKEEDVRGTA